MTETLERPKYETPVLAKTGLQKEKAIAELGDVTPWDSGDGSEAYELGQTVDPVEGDESESGRLELSTNVLDDRVVYIKMPVSETENDETQYKIFRVGADGSGMTWLNEVSVGEDGQWGTELNTRAIIANSGQETTVGRSEDTPNALHVDGQLVSRVQFRITGEKGGKLTIESGAMNGVEVVIAKERKRDPVQSIVLKGESVPLVMTPDAESEDQSQRLDGAHDLLAEALGETPMVDPVAEATARVLNVELPNHEPLAEVAPAPAVFAPPEVPKPISVTAENAIRDQIEQLQHGDGNPVIVELEKPTVEAQSVPETQEVELTPEERIREACQTPATLLEGLKDPEMPQDLKNAVQRLVDAYRDTSTAGQVGEMWNSDVVPKLIKIGDAPQEIQRAIESTAGDLMSRKTTLINAMNGAVSHRGGMFDDGNVDSMRRVKNEAENIRDQLGSGNHKTELSKLVDTARRSGVGAMYSEDEITSLGRKLSRNDDPPTMEDLEAIFANNANSIRNGLEGIRSVTNTLTANNEESSPNWRRRRDNIQELFGLLSRINQDEAVAGTSTQEVHAINLLDAVIDGANKVYGAMREGAYPQNRMNTLQNELVPNAIRGLDVVFKQSDDLKQLARRLQSMVAEIK